MISYIPLFIPFSSYFFPLIPHLSSTFSSLILFILCSSLSLVIITFLLHPCSFCPTLLSRVFTLSAFFLPFPCTSPLYTYRFETRVLKQQRQSMALATLSQSIGSWFSMEASQRISRFFARSRLS